ncbi:MAG TPA: hypothetical protein VF118_12215 [Gemmatimonadaceae bacterium]
MIGGDTLRYTVRGSDIDASLLRWAILDTSIATVDARGLVTSRRLGTTTLRAAMRADTLSTSIGVVGHPIVDALQDDVVLHATASNMLLAPSGDGYVQVAGTWRSEDTSIATVDTANGVTPTAVVTGTGLGHTRLWAHYGPDSASVLARVAPMITIDLATDTLLMGATRTLTATARDVRNQVISGAQLTWTTSDSAAATVASTGGGSAVVTAHLPGPALVSAGYEWATASTAFAVTLKLTSVATASTQACGLDTAGTVWCWFADDPIMLGTGPEDVGRGLQSPRPVQDSPTMVAVGGGYTTACGLSVIGHAWCWDRPYPTSPITAAATEGPATSFVQLAVGWNHRCGLTSSGAASCWVLDNSGNFGQGASGAPHTFSVLTAGVYHTCGIDGGTVYCWGAGARLRLGSATTDTLCGGYIYAPCSATPLAVPDLPPVVAVSAGNEHTCALTADGSAYCWGSNEYGQLGSGDPAEDLSPRAVADGLHFKLISAGYYHTCGLTTAGEVYCWGQADVDVGPSVAPYEACTDRLTGNAQRCYRTPTLVNGVELTTLSASWDHTCGIRLDGLPYCWRSGKGQ